MIAHFIQLARPYQWVKNLFLFLPIFFSGQILNKTAFQQACIGFLCFSLISSSVYCLNDIIDVEKDKAHPTKCKRPIASGALSVPAATTFMFFLQAVSLLILSAANLASTSNTILILCCYWLMNIAYSLKLKNIAIVDTCIIAIGFAMRVFAGGTSTGIMISSWIIMMTFLLTMFLAMGKRKDDVLIYKKTGIKPRQNTDH